MLYYRATAMRRQRLLLLMRRVTSLCDAIATRSRGASSYVHGTAEVPLTASTVGQLLQLQAERSPDRQAVVVSHQNTSLTFHHLLLQVTDRRGIGTSAAIGV